MWAVAILGSQPMSHQLGLLPHHPTRGHFNSKHFFLSAVEAQTSKIMGLQTRGLVRSCVQVHSRHLPELLEVTASGYQPHSRGLHSWD